MKRTIWGLLDKLVVAFDRRQRRRLGIWEFSNDPQCILRVGLTTTRIGAELSDGTVVRPGDTIGVIHFWNERMPPVLPTGADLAWARTFKQLLLHSLHLLAHHTVENPALANIQAFGGELPLVFTPATIRFIRRMGVEVFDPVLPRGLVRRVVDLGARTWTWLLRRAFNPGSARGVRVSDFARRPTWISRRTLVTLYAPDDSRVLEETRSAGTSESPKEDE